MQRVFRMKRRDLEPRNTLKTRKLGGADGREKSQERRKKEVEQRKMGAEKWGLEQKATKTTKNRIAMKRQKKHAKERTTKFMRERETGRRDGTFAKLMSTPPSTFQVSKPAE